ncbi:Cu(I)-responsive transcriptional regulator [Pseudomonas chlororaphis subsp. aurantiaca]|uniref:MerR family transcriptional regulator n=1 Tax=Pseudomonas chlororaphis TaxID=587753 RepID=UPI0008655FDB|nr:MerR family transcriptional regulator [Pseudomonas chlororaphis]BAV75624.1 MerR family transcriptional regulator [Pseudomonas chlororaphis subsp. aurantiaca]BBN55560.1 Cu(I)-responsive transcriptional regulator [Pseudomonas chlororaphis subsp. aurantiaca]
MFIGRLAELTGCTPKAIRLYEQMGLINEPERDGRYRIYNAHHLEIVHLIRRAQNAGFKLAEMSPLITAKNKLKAFPLAMANQAVDAKRQQVKERIAELQALDRHLIELKSEMNSLFNPHPGASPHKVETIACPDKQKPTSTPSQGAAG